MPPKKKARLASTPASKGTQDVHLQSLEDKSTSAKDEGISTLTLSDLWSDEQEISLFKGMIRWKPVGMHKHFRMIALSQYLRNHGYNPEKEVHTRIPSIWRKLGSLYNLEALDEREDSFGEIHSDESDPSKEPFFEFQLPSDEFKNLMFARRLAPAGSSSPVAVISNDGRDEPRPSTVDDSEEPRSSPVSVRGTKSSRGKRTSKTPRKSRLQVQMTPREKSGDRDTPEDGDEEDNKEDEKGEEEVEDEEGDEDEDEDDNNDEEGTPSSTTKARRGVGRPPRRVGRGNRGGRRKAGRRR